MSEGLVGFLVLLGTGLIISIASHILIKKFPFAILLSSLVGSSLFHLFAYLHDGPKVIMFLPISFTIACVVIAVISSIVGIAIIKIGADR